MSVFSVHDVLRIVHSLAQALRKGHSQQVQDASLFVELAHLRGFSPEQVDLLAHDALRFFDLDPHHAALHAELTARTDLHDWARILHANWNQSRLRFRTSGSTGAPVWHPYPLPLLTEELDAFAPCFASRSRIVSVMPVHHIFGMMYSLLLGAYLSVPVLYTPPLPLAGFFSALRPGDVIMAFPLFWQSLLTVVRHGTRLPENVLGVTATSPCPPDLIASLLHLDTPLVGMKEIYGSTETNGIGMRHDGAEWYELGSHWQSTPDTPPRIRRLHPDGSLGAPQDLPDIVLWRDSRHFRPEQRTDKAVQVGGINVYPERVAALIRTHPHVRDCTVRLMRPEEGARLKAFIVPHLPPAEAAPLFAKPFRDWLADNLETACRPKHIRLGTHLPLNSMGKAADWD